MNENEKELGVANTNGPDRGNARGSGDESGRINDLLNQLEAVLNSHNRQAVADEIQRRWNKVHRDPHPEQRKAHRGLLNARLRSLSNTIMQLVAEDGVCAADDLGTNGWCLSLVHGDATTAGKWIGLQCLFDAMFRVNEYDCEGKKVSRPEEAIRSTCGTLVLVPSSTMPGMALSPTRHHWAATIVALRDPQGVRARALDDALRNPPPRPSWDRRRPEESNT